MSYIKNADLTTAEIMQSPLGGAILSFEIGQLPSVALRRMFSPGQLEMLRFIRRDEAPERWDAVFAQAEPTWIWGHTPHQWSLAVNRLLIPSHRLRVSALHIGQWHLTFNEVLEHELVVIAAALGPAQQAIVTANGGAVYGAFTLPDPPEGAHLATSGQDIEVVKHLVLLAFPTAAAQRHAGWLLANAGAKVGQINGIEVRLHPSSEAL